MDEISRSDGESDRVVSSRSAEASSSVKFRVIEKWTFIISRRLKRSFRRVSLSAPWRRCLALRDDISAFSRAYNSVDMA